MDLILTIDKYIMTSIRVCELEDLIVDAERKIVRTTIRRDIAYSNVQVKTMDSLDETNRYIQISISFFLKLKE